MTIVTRRTLLVPYNDSLQSEFLMLNCCVKNRAEMNGPHTVATAKQLFQRILHDPDIHSMAVLDSVTRDYMGHVFICNLSSEPELGFIFDKAYWGKGIAKEALSAYFPKAIFDLKLGSIMATANTHHMASIKLLKHLGFKLVGEQTDSFGPFYEFHFTCDEVEYGTDQPQIHA